jgi:7-cyano-7-deazaguanine synthase
VEALFIDYGHPANIVERGHVKKLCQRYAVPLSTMTLSGAKVNSSGEIRGRNAFLITTALMARPDLSGLLSLGIHGGSPYYDCGERFLQTMRGLVADYTEGVLRLDVPWLEMDKRAVLDYCVAHSVPLELTYSCEMGTVPPCGKCMSCRDRTALGLRP